jgi:hypothetical protein
MKKENFIRKYGEVAYKKKLQKTRDWKARHREEQNAMMKEWHKSHQDKLKIHNYNVSHKGGKGYDEHQKYQRTGLQGKRHTIRAKHGNYYRPYKQIIAPDSQLHHQWIPTTPNYRGVALVEADQHMHGFIDVIQILEGEITLFTEKEIVGQMGEN